MPWGTRRWATWPRYKGLHNINSGTAAQSGVEGWPETGSATLRGDFLQTEPCPQKETGHTTIRGSRDPADPIAFSSFHLAGAGQRHRAEVG